MELIKVEENLSFFIHLFYFFIPFYVLYRNERTNSKYLKQLRGIYFTEAPLAR